MRIAAGILLILAGFMSIAVPQGLTEEVGLRLVGPTGSLTSFMMASSGFIAVSGLMLLVLTVGGGICALVKRSWWWALLGAIACVILGAIWAMLSLLRIPPLYHNVAGAVGAATVGILHIIAGLLAAIFLVNSKDSFMRTPAE